MKTTIVPAQVTTVEDKVAGNLSFTQLLLMITPVFLDGALFALFPPFMKVTVPKLVICATLATICLLLAIRIKGKLLLQWIAVISTYNIRPKYYIFNKNDLYLRNDIQSLQAQDTTLEPVVAQVEATIPKQFIPTPEMVRLETAVADPRAMFHIRAEKGGLRVYIREVKEESV